LCNILRNHLFFWGGKTGSWGCQTGSASTQSSGNSISGEQRRVLPVDIGLAEIFFTALVSAGKIFPGKMFFLIFSRL
jgi:hypothetical protein